MIFISSCLLSNSGPSGRVYQKKKINFKRNFRGILCRVCAVQPRNSRIYELELELIQTQMTQKPMLRAEVGMRVRCAKQASIEELEYTGYTLLLIFYKINLPCSLLVRASSPVPLSPFLAPSSLAECSVSQIQLEFTRPCGYSFLLSPFLTSVGVLIPSESKMLPAGIFDIASWVWALFAAASISTKVAAFE